MLGLGIDDRIKSLIKARGHRKLISVNLSFSLEISIVFSEVLFVIAIFCLEDALFKIVFVFDGIVMAFSMISKLNRLYFLLVFLMECLNGSPAVDENFNGSIVNFGDGLQLYVVTPNPVKFLIGNVVLEVSFDVVFEEILLLVDVLQAEPPDFSVVLFAA